MDIRKIETNKECHICRFILDKKAPLFSLGGKKYCKNCSESEKAIIELSCWEMQETYLRVWKLVVFMLVLSVLLVTIRSGVIMGIGAACRNFAAIIFMRLGTSFIKISHVSREEMKELLFQEKLK